MTSSQPASLWTSRRRTARATAFCKQAADRKLFPVSLSSNFLRNKNDLFNQWMDCGKDWTKLELVVTRKAEQLNNSKRQLRAVQGREQKAKKLVETRKAAGLFYLD